MLSTFQIYFIFLDVLQTHAGSAALICSSDVCGASRNPQVTENLLGGFSSGPSRYEIAEVSPGRPGGVSAGELLALGCRSLNRWLQGQHPLRLLCPPISQTPDWQPVSRQKPRELDVGCWGRQLACMGPGERQLRTAVYSPRSAGPEDTERSGAVSAVSAHCSSWEGAATRSKSNEGPSF